MRTHNSQIHTSPSPALLEVRNNLDESIARISALFTTFDHILRQGDSCLLDNDAVSGLMYLMQDERERLHAVQTDLDAYAKGPMSSAHLKLVNAN